MTHHTVTVSLMISPERTEAGSLGLASLATPVLYHANTTYDGLRMAVLALAPYYSHVVTVSYCPWPPVAGSHL